MASAEGIGQLDAPAPPARGRGRLAMYLVPIVAIVAVGQVSRALLPTILEEAPATLLFATSSITRLLLVQPLVPAALFFAIGITRMFLIGTLYWSFGREYGDTALRWSEERLGGSTSWLARFERGFRKAGHLLVVVWWSPIVAVMAGATGMRARVFLPLITLGAVGRISAIYFVGDWLEEPLTDVSQFIAKYALYLTPITIAITVFQVVMTRKKGRGLPIGTLDELQDDFEETEAEVAGEATVVAPPQPD